MASLSEERYQQLLEYLRGSRIGSPVYPLGFSANDKRSQGACLYNIIPLALAIRRAACVASHTAHVQACLSMVAEKGIPALRQYGARLPRARRVPVAHLPRARRPPAARPSPACRAPVARLSRAGACRAPAAHLSRAGARRPPVARRRLPRACRPPAARPSPACRAPVARLSRARRPPVPRASLACRARVARLSRACRPPAARSSRACRATGARQGPDRYQTFNIIIIIYYY